MGFFRFIGVTDIASVRFSLPAQLLEPTPNLGKRQSGDDSISLLMLGKSTGTTLIGLRRSSGQYVCANVKPALLKEGISIGDSEDGLGRMLAVLRFWFTKDLV